MVDIEGEVVLELLFLDQERVFVDTEGVYIFCQLSCLLYWQTIPGQVVDDYHLATLLQGAGLCVSEPQIFHLSLLGGNLCESKLVEDKTQFHLALFRVDIFELADFANRRVEGLLPADIGMGLLQMVDLAAKEILDC